MSFDISQTKTRVLASGAVLIAATALSSYFSVGLGGSLIVATLASMGSNIAANISASDLFDWMKRFGQNDNILDNPSLTEAVAKAIALIISKAADDDNLDSLVERGAVASTRESLRKLAKKTEDYWLTLTKATIDVDYDADIPEEQLVAMFSNNVQTFDQIKALNVPIWKHTINCLADEANVSLPLNVTFELAHKLFDDFPKALRDVLKHDAASGGQAFATMVLDLQGEAISTLEQVSAETQAIAKELKEVAKRQDIDEVIAKIESGFINTENLIEKLVTLDHLWQTLVDKATKTDQMKPEIANNLGIWNPAPKVPKGTPFHFVINLATSGYLILLEKNPEQQIWCLSPSFLAPPLCLEAGQVKLPLAYQDTFTADSIGREQMVAIITQDKLNLGWLPGNDDEPLEMRKEHLTELLEYLLSALHVQVLYAEYRVTE